jgi:hypothetical protein
MKPRMQLDGTLTGCPQWVRLPWLRGIYFPFWTTVNRIRKGWRAATNSGVELLTYDELIEVTTPLDQHPDGWEHACNCAECSSYE